MIPRQIVVRDTIAQIDGSLHKDQLLLRVRDVTPITYSTLERDMSIVFREHPELRGKVHSLIRGQKRILYTPHKLDLTTFDDKK